jgi:hypothetical protein
MINAICKSWLIHYQNLCYDIVTCMCVWDSRRGFGFDIAFTDHFNTQLVTTLNYSAIANLHILQITRAHANSFPGRSVFTSSCLVTVSNNGYSSASGLKSSLNGGSLPTAPKCSLRPAYISLARSTIENTVSNSSSIAARGLLPREPVCLRSLPRNGYTRYNIVRLQNWLYWSYSEIMHKILVLQCRFIKLLSRTFCNGRRDNFLSKRL